jgi:DNA-directed RNA polymerase subunit alpha
MATTSAKKKIEELLAESVDGKSIDRASFDQMLQHVYESYSNFDQAHELVKTMEAGREKASGEDARNLAEKLGVLHFALGEYEEAARDLDTVKTRKTAAHFLGCTYLQSHREQEAVDMLEKGRAGEDDLSTDVPMVEALCALGRPEEAQKLLKKHAGTRDSAELLYARGRAVEAMGEYGEAMALYEAALAINPDHAAGLFRLALNCDMNGEDARAIDLYKRCAGLRPSFVGALINLGILYEDQGNYYEAIDCYKRVLAIDPRHRQAQLYLKDAEASLTMYIDVSRSKRLQRMDEFFGTPSDAGEELDEGEGVFALTAGSDEEDLGEQSEDPEMEQKLSISVEELELSTRCRKCMDRLGITSVGELIQHSEEDLLATPNFGSTSLSEVKTKLSALGLSLKGE